MKAGIDRARQPPDPADAEPLAPAVPLSSAIPPTALQPRPRPRPDRPLTAASGGLGAVARRPLPAPRRLPSGSAIVAAVAGELLQWIPCVIGGGLGLLAAQLTERVEPARDIATVWIPIGAIAGGLVWRLVRMLARA